MKFKYIFFLLAAVISTASNTVAASNSLLSSGKWIKIKVESDGVYGLTDSKLRELGFSDPSKVKVYGYEPTILLDHNPELTPEDLPMVQSVYENGQLMFFVRGNVDIASEILSPQRTTNYIHEITPYSKGATYFLSDVDCQESQIETYSDSDINEEEEVESESIVLNTHKSVIYHEDEAENYADGGIWFTGVAFNGGHPTESYNLTLSKVADSASVEMFYVGILSPEANNVNNYIQTVYDNDVTVTSTSGTYCRAVDTHEIFRTALRLQKLQLPATSLDGDFSFNVEFSVNPSAATMVGPCALDYYILKYDKLNDLSGETQAIMYFDNTEAADFTLSGMKDGLWQVWNVTDSGNAMSIVLEASSEGAEYDFMGNLPARVSNIANTVVAFRTDVEQPEPEIVGEVFNQNLRALDVPELLIITSDVMLPSADIAAEFHREHQGIEVAVVDQQHIFNEYSSGNVSPEGVRLFVNDLYKKDNGKLKAVLLIGPASFNNANAVSPDRAEVVTNQNEDFSKSAKVTHNFCNDAFYGYIGGPVTTGNWGSRNRYYKIFGNTERIPVGRLPFSSIDDVRAYYSKAEKYITNPPSVPAIGNIVLASDYAAANEASHMYDASTLALALGESADSTITVTYAASNLYSTQNNTINRKVMMKALERGALMMAYFGHGDVSQVGGSTTTTDYLIHTSNADNIQTHGRFAPLYFFGSCYVGAFDQTQSTLAAALAKQEFGGSIASIVSSRSVYQPENRALGQAIVKELYGAKDGTWLGEIWKNALTFTSKDVIDYICNQLSYNFIGDPAMPLFASTNDVIISSVNGEANSLIAQGLNEVSGYVADSEGTVDEDFNGNVILTVYDVPVKLPNLTKTSGMTLHSTYVDSVATDFSIIGEYAAPVNKGAFTINFAGIASAFDGTHRIQAYAYSSDGLSRGVGCEKNLSLIDGEAYVSPDVQPIQINSFIAGEGLSDEVFAGTCMLYADITAEAGLASVSSVQNPARLVIDGVTHTNVARMLNYAGEGKYTFEYPLTGLSLGRHQAELKVQDANGDWAVSEIEFTSFIAPEAELSMTIDDDKVIFDLSTLLSNPDSSMLVIETLSGEPVEVLEVETFPIEVELASGAYRAFVQLKESRSVTSTPKLDIIID